MNSKRVVMVEAAVILYWMVGITVANRCNISAPKISLSEIHAGCNNDAKSRHPDCVSAMHRFCGMIVFPKNITTLGVSREHTNSMIGMSCIHSKWSGSVSISTLQRFHGLCTVAKSQHRDCLSAIHGFCKDTLGGPQFAGTSQEVPSSSHLYVHCFESTRKEHVRHDVLYAKNGGCRYPNSDSNHCYSAASRWCATFGYSGGITQEVNTAGITVACYNAQFSNNEFVARTTGFYQAERSVAQMCGPINFNTNGGTISSQTPQLLKMETYDNTASSVALRNTFEVTKEITETHSFMHHNTFTYTRIDTSISTKLPYFDGSEIKLSEFSTSVSLTSENLKTFTYSVTSPVEVPPGHAIIKKAIMYKAILNVPWSTKVVNGLGEEKTMFGEWSGVSTYKYYASETENDNYNCTCLYLHG